MENLFLKELKEIKKEYKKLNKAIKYNGNCYETNNDIFSLRNDLGDARVPYLNDGKNLTIHQNGKISLNESNYFILPDTIEGETNFLSFFLGIFEKSAYNPISLFEFNRNLFEKNVTRYTVFKKGYTIFVLNYNHIEYALKIGLSRNKNLLFELLIKNSSNKDVDLYSSMYFNPMMMHGVYSSVETKWFKKIEIQNNEYKINTIEDLSRFEHLFNKASLYRYISNDNLEIQNTTSRGIYSSSRTGRIESSECLLSGSFNKEKEVTNFSDTAICGDIIKFKLKAKENISIGYFLLENSKDCFNNVQEINEELNIVNALKEKEIKKEFVKFKFKNDINYINDNLMSSFLNNVVYQVDYCASTKNSTLLMLGARDILQAIEAQITFKPKAARKKLLEVMNFVNFEDGRLPRQYSLPSKGNKSILIDSREFIDQGLWLFDVVYQYLAYTDDYDILKEKLGYIDLHEDNSALILDEKDSMLEHLNKVMSFLINNIDENTHCLKALYGDWNDALDGLGKKKGKINEFGNGVSIMATFQLYSSLNKFIKIIDKIDEGSLYKKYLIEIRNKLIQGINKNAFVKEGDEYKVLHGWGNDKEYFVGSFKDIDGESRDSLTSNAFYIISGFDKEDSKYIESALKAYQRLDSKYGLKTFEPYFEREFVDVGRIVNLPKGTAENGATYIHGTCFGIDSLFIINQEKMAFEQLYKILPITHEFVSSTPFVMPNSYLFNLDLGCDGESMNDWFTGSSSTLLKTFVKNIFGLNVTLNTIEIKTVSDIPYKESEIKIKILNKKVTLKHFNTNDKNRRIIINGKETELEKDCYGRLFATLNKKDLKPNNLIEVYN